MQHSNIHQDLRVELTARALAAKALKDLSWEQVAADTGLSLAYVTAAVLGVSIRCPSPPRSWSANGWA
ncbi:hypothetical protein JOS77_16540 [Chromobacterium haemolyticum]|nr:hypothetical protein JOS77_16540 [Chromobacterium haemolyticum]